MKLIIVGSGVAGVTTARYVAERDPSIEIVIYSDESLLYYPRPRLIDLVAGRLSQDEIPLYSAKWYQDRGIRLRLQQRIEGIDAKGRRVLLASGEADSYDVLVLATGAHPWIPPIPGAELRDVYTLRTVQDALALYDKAQRSKRAVVLGGGLLGLDTSAALCAHNLEVCTIEALPRLLPKQLDPQGAVVLGRIISEKGINFIAGDLCTRIEELDGFKRVYLKSGRVLESDLVVISTGIRSNIQLAEAAGLACHRGVVVNDCLQTSDPAIYAVGDVAEFQERVWGIIPAAVAQARVAAAQIAGDTATRYQDIVPSTTLKVTGIDLTSIGIVNPQEEGMPPDSFIELRREDAAAGIYKKLVLSEGRVIGAILLGDRADIPAINQLIARRIDVSPYIDTLLDEGTDLMALVQSQTTA